MLEFFTKGKFMSFFPEQKAKPESEPEVEKSKKEKLHKHGVPRQTVIIDGSNLIKASTEDNGDILEGKVDIQTPMGWVPFNYDGQTGEMK